MIIQGLLDLFYNVFNLLTSFIEIPGLPDDQMGEAISYGIEYIQNGLLFLANFFPMEYFRILFGLIISVDVGIAIYHFVMWIIRKIPMAGMS